MTIGEIFTSREIATAIWTAIISVIGFSVPNIRKSIVNVLRAFFRPRILVWVGILALYITGAVAVLKSYGLWSVSLLKDTIIWFFFSGLVLSMKLAADSKENVFQVVILENLKAIIIVEFLVNTYTFSFPIEMILLPAVGFVGIIDAFSQTDKRYYQVRKISSAIL